MMNANGFQFQFNVIMNAFNDGIMWSIHNRYELITLQGKYNLAEVIVDVTTKISQISIYREGEQAQVWADVFYQCICISNMHWSV